LRWRAVATEDQLARFAGCDQMQAELAAMFSPVERGRVPPALDALASLLQAALGVPDHEAVELAVVDMRWQTVLGCLGRHRPRRR